MGLYFLQSGRREANDFNCVEMADDDHSRGSLRWQFIIIGAGALLVFSETLRQWLYKSALFLFDLLKPDVWP